MKGFKIFAFQNIPLILILFIYTSCRKTLERGTITQLTGLVSDPISQKPVPNGSIHVQEYVGGSFGSIFSKVIDSTKCDVNGKYSISFATTGHGLEYRLAFFSPSNYYSQADPVKISIGKDNIVNFTAVKIHLLKARIIVSNNPNPPLRVYSNISGGGNISGKSGDSTIFMKVLPNLANLVYFTITNIDTPTKYNVRIDTVLLSGFADTFSHTFMVNPQLFKRRL